MGLFERYLTPGAACHALFGPNSEAALATAVGLLVEVPVILSLVYLINQTGLFENTASGAFVKA